MSDASLDLRNQPRVVDFLVEAMEYAPAKERAEAEKMVERYQEEAHVPTDKLAGAARTLAFATFPPRFAVKQFFTTDGTEEEWVLVFAVIRPSTAHLLKRVRKSSGASSLDAVLAHADAESALKEEELHEIEQVRGQIRAEYWKSHAKALAILVKEGEAELKAFRTRFDKLRDLAVAMPRSLQDEIFSKINHYEDRILYAGETIALATLDEELQYYSEQKAISPLDE